jgi:hypothetical protein
VTWHGDGRLFTRSCAPSRRIAILALFTWSEPFIPSESPLSPTAFTDLWACFERGPAVSELGYVVVWWFVERKGWRGGSTVILLARKGQNRLFQSHLVSGDCGEDDVVRSWRPELHRRVRGSHRRRPTSLSIGREGRRLPTFLLHPVGQTSPLFPLIRTLAATANFLQIPVDSGRVRRR